MNFIENLKPEAKIARFRWASDSSQLASQTFAGGSGCSNGLLAAALPASRRQFYLRAAYIEGRWPSHFVAVGSTGTKSRFSLKIQNLGFSSEFLEFRIIFFYTSIFNMHDVM